MALELNGLRVLVLSNMKAGLRWSFDDVQDSVSKYWEAAGAHVVYQFCRGIDDVSGKTRQAVKDGLEVILVAGGDGTVNLTGRELMNTSVRLGVIPTGSGNGFARHFAVPLNISEAIKALAAGRTVAIDVGMVDNHPFFVTCSMAWDARIAEGFQKFPFRGILPYVFAGVQEFLDYRPQPIRVQLETGKEYSFPDPLLFTVANLTEFGGGAKIAADARPDDGFLELVAARHRDGPKLLANIGRLFDGTLGGMPEVFWTRFRSMKVRREHSAPIQVDGDLLQAGSEINVEVVPACLNVIVPG